jgi:Na+/alanine symporter
MVVPNVIALIALYKTVVNEVKDADDIKKGQKLLKK